MKYVCVPKHPWKLVKAAAGMPTLQTLFALSVGALGHEIIDFGHLSAICLKFSVCDAGLEHIS